MKSISQPSIPAPTAPAAHPTGSRLLRAAVSGLLGVGGAACGDDGTGGEPDPDEHECTIDDVDASALECMPPEEEEKVIKEEVVQKTFAELQAMCEEAGGYLQTHASCSGTNTCAGFTYGDWGEDAVFSEHTCSGVNGCSGLSCGEMKSEREGGELSGEEIMKLDEDWYEENGYKYGPAPCRNCHVPSAHNAATDAYDYDYSKLRLLMWPDSTRDASNWTERSAKMQEAQIAFGVQGVTEEGLAYSNMASYRKIFTKKEIENVVEFMRGFDAADVVVEEIKLHPGEPE